MLAKVPKNRIAWGKRVLKLEEDNDNAKDKVLVTCADNTEFTADVVVGADGVYSSVRQNMYKVMSDKGILPKIDKEPLHVGFTCMVGLTGSMDPEKYPELKDDVAHFRSVVGGARHNVRLIYSCCHDGVGLCFELTGPHLFVVYFSLSGDA